MLPFFWLHRGGESATLKRAGKYEAQVYMDMYARSSAEAQRMENAVAFLDDYNPAPNGNAMSIRYELASKTQLSEAEQREHITVLYRVTYADKRQLIPR